MCTSEPFLVILCDTLFRRSKLIFLTFESAKGLGTCDALLCVSNTLQSALESGQEARIVQIDFSAAFDIIIIIIKKG